MRLIDADALDYELGTSDRDIYVRECLAEAPSVVVEPHWIPVTEDTLPEEGRIVVVCGEKGTWDYGKYRGYGPNIHYWYWKNKTFKKVYWWMYKEDALPEPYKGGG